MSTRIEEIILLMFIARCTWLDMSFGKSIDWKIRCSGVWTIRKTVAGPRG